MVALKWAAFRGVPLVEGCCVLKPILTALLGLTAWIVITTAAAPGIGVGAGSGTGVSSHGQSDLVSGQTLDTTPAAIAIAALQPASRMVSGTVASAALKRDIPLIVYLPAGYENPAGYETSSARLPVLYLLHGAGGDEREWSGPAGVQALADRLIASGALPPAIIAMPGCPECWWVDGLKDKAETAFWSDLVPAVESRYRTMRSREGRLVAGLSAGGYGAIRFGLKYPDRIGAVAALSPAIYADTPPSASAARSQPPFVAANGAFDEQLWDDRNYPSLLPAYIAQKFRVPMYLTAGDHDSFGIAFETALLHKRLLEVQPHITELRVVDGDHNWGLWSATLADAMTFVFRNSREQRTMAGQVLAPATSPR